MNALLEIKTQAIVSALATKYANSVPLNKDLREEVREMCKASKITDVEYVRRHVETVVVSGINLSRKDRV